MNTQEIKNRLDTYDAMITKLRDRESAIDRGWHHDEYMLITKLLTIAGLKVMVKVGDIIDVADVPIGATVEIKDGCRPGTYTRNKDSGSDNDNFLMFNCVCCTNRSAIDRHEKCKIIKVRDS